MHGRSQGFTLLEMLVALAVLALALGATLQVAGNAALATARLADRSWGQWLATNTLNNQLLSPTAPTLGTTRESTRFGGRDWRVDTQSEPLTVGTATLRRLTVRVFTATAGANELVAELTGLWAEP